MPTEDMKVKPTRPSNDLIDQLTQILGVRPTGFARVTGGYTAADRWRCTAGSDRFFVKQATTDITADMLHRELKAYRVLNLPMMPAFIAGSDDPKAPFLVIEDLSDATWPPPWTPARVDTVLQTIQDMHHMTAPAELAKYQDVCGFAENSWETVASDPQPFLSLGLISEQALADVLPDLIAAAAECKFDGTHISHWDLRSDNMCITDRGVVLIDWPNACASDPTADLAGWLPSLAQEGGPLPDEILPDAPEAAAWVAGYFAARAGLPLIPDAPRVRHIQKAQLSTALPWALRAIGRQDERQGNGICV